MTICFDYHSPKKSHVMSFFYSLYFRDIFDRLTISIKRREEEDVKRRRRG